MLIFPFFPAQREGSENITDCPAYHDASDMVERYGGDLAGIRAFDILRDMLKKLTGR